ncbi:MAG: hypothetical protein RMJ35_12570 [Phycisphaerales bacterium]|nr:hypothetical protein [Phycisphaerales bacterium]
MITIDPTVLARKFDHPAERPDPRPSSALHQRLALLPPDDRLLMQLVLVDRLSIRRAASVLSLCPGTACRRVRRLRGRLEQPLVSALLSRTTDLPEDLRLLAIDHFLRRRRLRELAAETGKTTRQVKAALEFVKVWWRASANRRSSGAF